MEAGMAEARDLYAEQAQRMQERQGAMLDRRRARRRAAREGLSPLAAAAIAGGAVLATALIGRRYAPDRSHPAIRRWYRSLDKPAFTPPDPAFGVVWPALEALLAVAGYRLMREPSEPARNAAIGLWALNVAMIAGWTKAFFGERSLDGGFAAATAQLGAGVAYVEAARRVDPAAAALGAPYTAWLAFASLVAEEVWRENAR